MNNKMNLNDDNSCNKLSSFRERNNTTNKPTKIKSQKTIDERQRVPYRCYHHHYHHGHDTVQGCQLYHVSLLEWCDEEDNKRTEHWLILPYSSCSGALSASAATKGVVSIELSACSDMS